MDVLRERVTDNEPGWSWLGGQFVVAIFLPSGNCLFLVAVDLWDTEKLLYVVAGRDEDSGAVLWQLECDQGCFR